MIRAGESSENGTFQNNYSSFCCAVRAESCQERLETLNQGPRRQVTIPYGTITLPAHYRLRTTDGGPVNFQVVTSFHQSDLSL